MAVWDGESPHHSDQEAQQMEYRKELGNFYCSNCADNRLLPPTKPLHLSDTVYLPIMPSFHESKAQSTH